MVFILSSLNDRLGQLLFLNSFHFRKHRQHAGKALQPGLHDGRLGHEADHGDLAQRMAQGPEFDIQATEQLATLQAADIDGAANG